jgi:hypothetical protein
MTSRAKLLGTTPALVSVALVFVGLRAKAALAAQKSLDKARPRFVDGRAA